MPKEVDEWRRDVVGTQVRPRHRKSASIAGQANDEVCIEVLEILQSCPDVLS
jgi:hypothetical protein